MRPCVILNASERLATIPVIIVAPGTSNLGALRFPHTVRVEPNRTNGLDCVTVFYGFQLQTVDRSWIGDRRGCLSGSELRRLEDAILEALGFDPPNES